MAAAQEKAVSEGIPLHEAIRTVGHEPGEFIAQRSALIDLQDAQEDAERRRLMRQALVKLGLLDVSEAEPSERAVELAAEAVVRSTPPAEPFDVEAAAKGIRGRWLRRQYRGME
jgi:hypothetical protein